MFKNFEVNLIRKKKEIVKTNKKYVPILISVIIDNLYL